MDIKRDVQDQFGKSASAYVSSAIHKDGKDLAQMVNMASTTGQETLLDVATGGGHTANAFAPLVAMVTAIDLTSEMLEAAEKYIKGNRHKNVSFIKADAEKLPFEQESYDLVTCRIAPHHFPNVDQFVREVYRVLKRNGQFLLNDNVVPEDDEFDYFYNQIEKIRDYSHFRAWKKTEWMKMLEKEGFEIIETHRFVKTFRFEPWCNRMNLPTAEKEKLTQFILNSTQKIKDKFRVRVEDGHIVSFQGEAFILKAVKM
ncbi:MAG: class I SAM-dependent methyltransferase [Neobacillus sp.]